MTPGVQNCCLYSNGFHSVVLELKLAFPLLLISTKLTSRTQTWVLRTRWSTSIIVDSRFATSVLHATMPTMYVCFYFVIVASTLQIPLMMTTKMSASLTATVDNKHAPKGMKAVENNYDVAFVILSLDYIEIST